MFCLVWIHRFSRVFWLFLCDPCHSLQYYGETDRGHTQTAKKADYIDEFTPKKHRKTSKLSLPYLFYSKKWKHWYLAFADLSILFLIQSLNGRLKRDTDSLERKLNLHNALITWAWDACDESLSRIDSSVHLGKLWWGVGNFWATGIFNYQIPCVNCF